MAKTLVIAEKPSVGRDISVALDGTFQRRTLEELEGKKPSKSKDDTSFLESDDYVITWAVGHLVTLSDPEDYDEKLKKWRMADLPIVPDAFTLKPRDARSKKQLRLIQKLLAREDVDRVVNACDAGREGELIFAYIYEAAGSEKPVDRLWINSMTK
jgi:DNA topoisomerase III